MKKFIILSDIHSNWDALKQLENIEEFNDKNSHIIFAGDYIDGENQIFGYGLKVLDYIMDLVKQKKATALLGNHDDFWVKTSNYNFESYDLWMLNGGRETFDNNGLKDAEGFLEIVGMLNSEPLYKYTEFLKMLPNKFINDNILVVHAGIDWRSEIEEQDEHDLLWSRVFYINSDLIDIKNIPKGNLERVIVSGHTPTSLISRIKDNNDIVSCNEPCRRYFIDGNSKMGRYGQINVLVLNEFGNELNRYILK